MIKQYYVEDRLTGRNETISLKTIVREIDLTDSEVDRIAGLMQGDIIFLEPHLQIRRELNDKT